MKRPTTASLKKVTPENLAALGVERLAELLVVAAEARPDLKRRLRMELAAAQGADHLAPEIDRRLTSLETSRGKISWRQRPAFVRDLEELRRLIVERLAALDPAVALSRLWAFMGVASRVSSRLRDKDGALAAVFDRAAQDLGRLLAQIDVGRAADSLVEAMVQAPAAWEAWLPRVLQAAAPELAATALRRLSERQGAVVGWITLIRRLADAAGDPGAYQATFTHPQLLDPSVAAEVAQRMLAADRVGEAAALLEASRPGQGRRWTPGRGAAAPDFAWESAWIEVLERSGRGDDAQAARWASFERTLSAERARDFTKRLADFDDVEAESRAFAHVAAAADFRAALRFLMDWPALPEAARLIQARPDDIEVADAEAELWAAKLRVRQPAAAHLLLRKAAAAAFRRRDFATCDRLTAEADTIGV
ncbi:MAG: hypothetical protein E7812_00185 [Phenylobacterium sp.]|nr:MAG: hypothetical protein E7812_00185 [Phenylobacterium sp.]